MTETTDCKNNDDPRQRQRGHQWQKSRFQLLPRVSEHTWLCLACSELRRFNETLTEEEADAMEKASVAALNENALHGLRREHPAITFPDSMKERSVWRVTQRTVGTVSGFEFLGAMKILTTNGVVAWYERPAGAVWLGHVAPFTGEVRPLFSAGKKTTSAPARGPKLARKTGRMAELLAAL